MKKLRLMLSLTAVEFAIAGAIAASALPLYEVYYKVTTTTCSSVSMSDQACFLSNIANLPLCTVTINGIPHQAYKYSDCTGVLRYAP